MNEITEIMLRQRFQLRKTKHISERFEKSPCITRCHAIPDFLRICYADEDYPILSYLAEALHAAYIHTLHWFGATGDLQYDFWVAPNLVDLQYMAALPCDEGFFCAPGIREGNMVVVGLSPRAYQIPRREARYTGCLAHEIAHHLIRERAGATILAMKRQENRDLPMWFEEGLCQVIQSEYDIQLQTILRERVNQVQQWLPLYDLWNDLSACGDAATAYLQAYRGMLHLLEKVGKAHLIELLNLNAARAVDWTALMADMNQIYK